MIVSLIILSALVAVGLLLYLLDKRSKSASPSPSHRGASSFEPSPATPSLSPSDREAVSAPALPGVNPSSPSLSHSEAAPSPSDREASSSPSPSPSLSLSPSPSGLSSRSVSSEVAPSRSPDEEDSELCCGMHLTCEKDSLLADVSDRVEYFDDEELDRFAGRLPETYTPAEIEEFRDILMTLIPSDISPWARSIQLRGISLPPEIRDELLFLVAENRRPSPL